MNNRRLLIALGIAATLAEAALWHGPLGAADRFAAKVERQSRAVLDHYEMTMVDAHLARDPLRRRLLLSGTADEFQRGELLRMMDDMPGVGSVRWVDSSRPATIQLPLLAEAELFALVGFGFGLLLTYLLELRRRHRAEWRW
jgi:hypothetical protein